LDTTNPLETLIQLLSQVAGPRGSTFSGRVIPQGQTPNLRALMTQQPTESPDAEGLAGAGASLATGLAAGTKRTMSLPGIIGYELIDNQTGRVIRTYGPNARHFAAAAEQKLTGEYGGNHYHVKPIMENLNP